MKRILLVFLLILPIVAAFSETEEASGLVMKDLISQKEALVQELNNLDLQISNLLSSAASISLKAQEEINELYSQTMHLEDKKKR